MEKLKGAITIELFLEEAEAINKLIEKDTPAAIVPDGHNPLDNSEMYACPACMNRIYSGDYFCRNCGQRLDLKTVAFWRE